MRFDTHQLTAFAAVIREGSFERASRALHVTPSAVSQRIKQLEELVGQVLVVRRTPCVPTRAGEALYRHALQVALLESEVLGDLLEPAADRTASAATIAVAVNADSLATWLVPDSQMDPAGWLGWRTLQARACALRVVVPYARPLCHRGADEITGQPPRDLRLGVSRLG